MDNKNNNKNRENQSLAPKTEANNQALKSGIYLRDDHCDWGSSGMNEYTNEYGENK